METQFHGEWLQPAMTSYTTYYVVKIIIQASSRQMHALHEDDDFAFFSLLDPNIFPHTLVLKRAVQK